MLLRPPLKQPVNSNRRSIGAHQPDTAFMQHMSGVFSWQQLDCCRLNNPYKILA